MRERTSWCIVGEYVLQSLAQASGAQWRNDAGSQRAIRKQQMDCIEAGGNSIHEWKQFLDGERRRGITTSELLQCYLRATTCIPQTSEMARSDHYIRLWLDYAKLQQYGLLVYQSACLPVCLSVCLSPQQAARVVVACARPCAPRYARFFLRLYDALLPTSLPHRRFFCCFLNLAGLCPPTTHETRTRTCVRRDWALRTRASTSSLRHWSSSSVCARVARFAEREPNGWEEGLGVSFMLEP